MLAETYYSKTDRVYSVSTTAYIMWLHNIHATHTVYLPP